MPFISFNKATHPDVDNDIRISRTAVRFVETATSNQHGQAIVHLLRDHRVVVMEDIGSVVSAIGSLTPVKRHSNTAQSVSEDTIYIAPETISHLHPNVVPNPTFWIVYFVDGSQIKINAPLPDGW